MQNYSEIPFLDFQTSYLWQTPGKGAKILQNPTFPGLVGERFIWEGDFAYQTYYPLYCEYEPHDYSLRVRQPQGFDIQAVG